MSNVQNPVAQSPANPKWEVVATPALKEVGAFLQSRKTTLTSTLVLDASQGVPLSKEGVLTYSLAQVTAFAVDVLELCADRHDCKDMGEPSKMGRKALGKAFVAESVYSNVSKLIVVKQLNQFRGTLKRARKADRVAAAVTAGTHWFADGVVFAEKHERAGEHREFPSRKKAIGAYLRSTVGDNWSKQANKGELKDNALAFVRQGSLEAPTAQETRDAAATTTAAPAPAPAPVATQSSVSSKVSKADLVKQAVALGITQAAAKKMNKNKLTALVDALSNL